MLRAFGLLSKEVSSKLKRDEIAAKKKAVEDAAKLAAAAKIEELRLAKELAQEKEWAAQQSKKVHQESGPATVDRVSFSIEPNVSSDGNDDFRSKLSPKFAALWDICLDLGIEVLIFCFNQFAILVCFIVIYV